MLRTALVSACLVLAACQTSRQAAYVTPTPAGNADELVQAIGVSCHEQFKPPQNATPEQRLTALSQKYDCIAQREAAQPAIVSSPFYDVRRRYLAAERAANERFIRGEITEAEAMRLIDNARVQLASETQRTYAASAASAASAGGVTVRTCRFALTPSVSVPFPCI